MWIDGAGTMTLLVDRDLNNQPTAVPQPINVAWQGRMSFNGRQATFERAVEALREQQLLKTETLEVFLDRRIDFANPRQTDRPEVAGVRCRGGVTMSNRRFDDDGLLSTEELRALDLSVS